MLQSLKDELVDRVYAGQLRAFGVERQGDSGPIHIPLHYFLRAAKIDWDRDYVAALDKEFHNVTVQGVLERADKAREDTPLADPGLIDPELEPVPQPPNDRTPGKLRGRPSKADEIEQAINILLEKGIDLASMPRPQAYAAIRKCAEKEMNANTKIGFTDPVIQRFLFRRFGRRR